MEANLNKMLVATMEGHMLYLYSSDVNKYDIQSAFISLGEDKIVYISDANPKKIERLLPGVEVARPESLAKVKASRIIFDGGSINSDKLKYEDLLSGKNVPVLCTYPASSVNTRELKKLVSCHTNMILATDSATMLSSKSLKDTTLSEESIEKWIKKNLETVVLALLLKKPMSGKDIIKTIHINFKTLVSPGRVYPLLHELSGKNLITFEYQIRDKVYKPVESGAIEGIINKELAASQLLLNKFASLE